MAVGSPAPRINIEFILSNINMVNVFRATVACEDTIKSKPDPDTFIQAAERLGAPPGYCIVVEDAVAGVQAGKAAGMPVVAVTNTCARETLGQDDRVVDSLCELKPNDFAELLPPR